MIALISVFGIDFWWITKKLVLLSFEIHKTA